MKGGTSIGVICALLALFVVDTHCDVKCYISDPNTGKQKRIYTIAHGHDWGAYEYVDKAGAVKGFVLDLIREVCQAAGVQCNTVWEPYNNCIQSKAGQHMRGGQGLMDKWYDGCIGWAVSLTRAAFFGFSQSFLKASRARFYVKASGSEFNPENWENYKIGFMDGWVDDEKCLNRLNPKKSLPTDKILHFKSTDDLKESIINGTVDAGHIEEGLFDSFTAPAMSNPTLKRSGGHRSCVLRGDAVMTRKDSNFPAVWNNGFEKLVSSGRFDALCKEANKTHNADAKGIINCV